MPITRLEIISEIAGGLSGDFIPHYEADKEWMYLALPKNAMKAKINFQFSFYSYGVAGYELGADVEAEMSFPEVEDIISKYYRKFNIPYQQFTCHKYSCRLKEVYSSEFEYRISNPGDTQKIIDKVQVMVDDVMPFFERFKTLEDVYTYLESDECENKSGFLNNQGFVERRLILRAMFKAPNFLELGEKYMRFLKKDPVDSNYMHEARYAPELYEELCTLYAQ